jgi:hypothetical protein
MFFSIRSFIFVPVLEKNPGDKELLGCSAVYALMRMVTVYLKTIQLEGLFFLKLERRPPVVVRLSADSDGHPVVAGSASRLQRSMASMHDQAILKQ